ncbi:MAG: hypothetical protein DWQ47_09565 [Acidobacteria bacterium]|nr:MAG: hypothetical protein DWQ32_17665 [Acidobacteriota bacterium]REJ98853.1 MAG: hypothetical protein DWQ38_12310 [Acidobacteriota bacterium]REK16427.1 MAG: hypothetical protein DWQ43_05375 [Acidobacteriota bacterium]REK44108.1 MAG: hypothetical protein DWQ47_09565 [Acidobacteriota bacterium]
MKQDTARKQEEQTPSLHGRAMENLEYIRDAMQRSTEFTAVPGYGGVLMGVTAIGAGIIAEIQTEPLYWLATWMVEALLAFLIGSLAMWQKSRDADTALIRSRPAQKFAIGFLPPLLAGVILTGLILYRGSPSILPPVWLALYGASVVTGGAYSVKPVPLMGWIFMLIGGAAVFARPELGNYFMIAGFGVVHIIFGLIIGRKYGG